MRNPSMANVSSNWWFVKSFGNLSSKAAPCLRTTSNSNSAWGCPTRARKPSPQSSALSLVQTSAHRSVLSLRLPFGIGDLEERIRNPETAEPLTVWEILRIEEIALRLGCGRNDQ